MNLLFLFFAGVAQDLLITLWSRAVAVPKKYMASIMAGVVTLVSTLLLANVLLVDHDRLLRVLALASGNVVGTFLVIQFEEIVMTRFRD